MVNTDLDIVGDLIITEGTFSLNIHEVNVESDVDIYGTLQMLDFTIVNVLAAIFTPDFNISSSLKVANFANSLLDDRLDGEPTILPIPQDAPAEIPRVTLKSSDNLLSLSISPSRTNLEFKIPLTSIVEMIDYSTYYSNMSKFFVEFSSGLNLRVQRLGYVTDRLIIMDDALSYIMKRFCNTDQTSKGRPFYNPKRFEMHSLKNYDWEGYQINSWVRIKFIPVRIEDKIKPSLWVQNDLNTLSNEEDPGADFKTEEIQKYFDNIPNHLNQILDLYFS